MTLKDLYWNKQKKDINTKSNLVLLEIKTFKTGRKITDLEFIFDYKNNEAKIKRDEEKHTNFINRLIEIVKEYIGKSIHDTRYGDMIVISYEYEKDRKSLFVIAERKTDKRLFKYSTRDFKDLKALQKQRIKQKNYFILIAKWLKILKKARDIKMFN